MSDGYETLRSLARRLKLKRPLCVLDLETTGVDVERDRVVELAALIVSPSGEVRRVKTLVRPDTAMPDAARAVHGLADVDLLGAPTFADIAASLAETLSPCDFAGYNVARFDLRLLAAEFRRAGVAYDPTKARVIDAMTIFHRQERRDLEAAVRLYCGRTHQGHRAEADVQATIDVLSAQLERYPELPADVESLDAYCRIRPRETSA